MTRLRLVSRTATVEVTIADGVPFLWWAGKPCPVLSRTIDLALADGGDFAAALVKHDPALRIERAPEARAA